MNFKLIKNNKGITLIEIVIVLSIITIISAIIAPNFLNTTDRARIRSDIQSALVIQNTIDLYKIETGKTLHSTDIKEVLTTLVREGYLSEQNGEIKPQTAGANWVIQNRKVMIDLSGTTIEPGVIDSLSDDEKAMLTNIPSRDV